MDFTREELLNEAHNWFSTHAGTYARLLDRTEENLEKAFYVFCDLGLFAHPDDVSCDNYHAFLHAFKSSSYLSDLTPKQLVEGGEEFKEILDLIY
tara:strand:+ start:944 stop:1228 length:285 start_codon:yes stop_codon:yes gene_type:complete